MEMTCSHFESRLLTALPGEVTREEKERESAP